MGLREGVERECGDGVVDSRPLPRAAVQSASALSKSRGPCGRVCCGNRPRFQHRCLVYASVVGGGVPISIRTPVQPVVTVPSILTELGESSSWT